MLFGNKIPREGTKTISSICDIITYEITFGNKIPREGTETVSVILTLIISYNLEIRYSERGRKRTTTHFNKSLSRFGNKIPREGTETLVTVLLNNHQIIWK